MNPGLAGFPGATSVSRLSVYDWPTADGLAGGSPHLHTASTEGYVVLGGHGAVQTLSGDGHASHPLAEGDLVWFTPGTVHRLINDGELEILVVMQNAGLPEAGDAIFTFPPEVLAEADYVGSTAGMIRELDDPRFVAGGHKVVMITECSMSDNVSTAHPELEFVRPCNLCPHMKRITLPKILESLEKMQHRVEVDPGIGARARLAVERMLTVGRGSMKWQGAPD